MPGDCSTAAAAVTQLLLRAASAAPTSISPCYARPPTGVRTRQPTALHRVRRPSGAHPDKAGALRPHIRTTRAAPTARARSRPEPRCAPTSYPVRIATRRTSRVDHRRKTRGRAPKGGYQCVRRTSLRLATVGDCAPERSRGARGPLGHHGRPDHEPDHDPLSRSATARPPARFP